MKRQRSGATTGSSGRPARQPTQTLFVGLLLLVFMCMVWSLLAGIRLPTFFQRLFGLVNALLAMLVVMFAIREYGKRYNRLPLPWFGRVSTSRIAGGLTFLAVFGWWLSPWRRFQRGLPSPICCDYWSKVWMSRSCVSSTKISRRSIRRRLPPRPARRRPSSSPAPIPSAKLWWRLPAVDTWMPRRFWIGSNTPAALRPEKFN